MEQFELYRGESAEWALSAASVVCALDPGHDRQAQFGSVPYLERIAATRPRRQQPAYVGEFHALGIQRGARKGPDEALRNDETIQFW